MTLIEQSDRGIVLAKSLAWTILAGVTAGGVFVGGQIATLSTQIDSLTNLIETLEERVDDNAAQARAMSSRVARGETAQARSDERYSSILAYLARIDSRLERFEGQISGGR